MFSSCMPDIRIQGPELKVVLNTDNNLYTAGDVIKGHIEVKLSEPTRIKDISVVIYGATRITWKESSRTHFKGVSSGGHLHQNVEVFLDYKLSLLSKEPSSLKRKTSKSSLLSEEEPEELVCQGRHTYPFECNLPRYMPASFTGKWGKTSYAIKGVIERMWKSDIINEIELDIMGYFDLNSQMDLVQVHFHFGDTSKKRLINVESIRKGEAVSPGSTLRWDDVIPLPFLPPSGGSHSTAIQIKYALVLCINHSSMYDDYELPLNFQVGTIQFRPSIITGYLALLSGDVAARETEKGIDRDVADSSSKAIDTESKVNMKVDSKANTLDSSRNMAKKEQQKENLNISAEG